MRFILILLAVAIGAVGATYWPLGAYLPPKSDLVTMIEGISPDAGAFVDNLLPDPEGAPPTDDTLANVSSQGGAVSSSDAPVMSSLTILDANILMEAAGWETSVLESASPSDQALSVTINDVSVFARLMDCADAMPLQCETLLLFANFDLGRAMNSGDSDTVNSFNDSFTEGRAYYLAKGDGSNDQVGVDMRVSLSGGVTEQHIQDEFASFETALQNFQAQFTQ